jgi:GTP-binding protein EngB required for normal cell division
MGPSDPEKPQKPAHPELLSLLHVAHELGNERIEREVRALADRVADHRFFVACLGQFKRGKSSLLNALVGSSVLPTGVVPVTAIVTILRHGPILRTQVHYENGAHENVANDSIADFVSEERNPGNFRGVAAVEIFVPCLLLSTGMCLVDTPGIGSVFAGNTAVTRAFVPHIDAALVVLGADPPISGEELALIEEIGQQIDDILFVLNKADRLSDRERTEAIDFARRTVADRTKRPIPRVFEVSAAEWLDRAGPSRDAPRLQTQLEHLARESGPRLVAAAERRGRKRLVESVVSEIDAQCKVLVSPIESSRQLADKLRETISDAERSLSDLRHLLRAEQERVSQKSAERRDRLLSALLPAARAEFHESLASSHSRGATLHAEATALAQTISRRLLDHWLAEERPAAEAMYRQSAQRFLEMANGFLRRLRDSGDPALASLPEAVSSDSGFRVKGRLYYGEHFGFPREGLAGWARNLVSSRERQIVRIEYQVAKYLDTLLSLNSTRILNDFDEIMRESARRLEAEIRGFLKDLQTTAQARLEHAEATRAAGAEAVKSELERLDALRARALALKDETAS